MSFFSSFLGGGESSQTASQTSTTTADSNESGDTMTKIGCKFASCYLKITNLVSFLFWNRHKNQNSYWRRRKQTKDWERENRKGCSCNYKQFGDDFYGANFALAVRLGQWNYNQYCDCFTPLGRHPQQHWSRHCRICEETNHVLI